MLLKLPPAKPATVAVEPSGMIPGMPFVVSTVLPVTPERFVSVTRLTSVPWCVPLNVSV